MTRRRSGDSEDSFDLLLDTVSNVFGGVMFLTLLAALLILSRGATTTEEPEVPREAIPEKQSRTLVDAEIRQVTAAVAAQKRIQKRLDPNGDLQQKSERLKSLGETLELAKRNARRKQKEVEAQAKALEGQVVAQTDLENEIDALREEVAKREQANHRVRQQSERTVEFRGLSRSRTAEAVVVLRYGRWYMLQLGKNGRSLNQRDFFIRREGKLNRVTPKPHRGNPVNDSSLGELQKQLKENYTRQTFHVVVAVWDDSFAEFNPVKDAVKRAGFQYRTLPCDSSTRLSNQYAADAYVQ